MRSAAWKAADGGGSEVGATGGRDPLQPLCGLVKGGTRFGAAASKDVLAVARVGDGGQDSDDEHDDHQLQQRETSCAACPPFDAAGHRSWRQLGRWEVHPRKLVFAQFVLPGPQRWMLPSPRSLVTDTTWPVLRRDACSPVAASGVA